MYIVKLQGGLGNQMFQYAAAKRVAGRRPVLLDISFLTGHTQSTDSFTARKLELGIFKNIKFKIAGKHLLNLLKNKNRYYRLLEKVFFPRIQRIWQSEKNEPIDLSAITCSIVYLDGYFQNELYFKEIRQQLLADFTFPEPTGEVKVMYDKIRKTAGAVAIHIRRGDYLKPAARAFHGLLPLSYYTRALEIIAMSVEKPFYFIFSDDPEWCSAHFAYLGDSAEIVALNTGESWTDMYLMSCCAHHIIANSSYSWWAAWLNDKSGKMVIAPEQWFVHGPSDIVTEQWIKI